MNYFSELQERIREIRISERFFYQKIKDIYTTSIDYNPKDEKTIHPIWSMEFGATYPYEETTPSKMSLKELKK